MVGELQQLLTLKIKMLKKYRLLLPNNKTLTIRCDDYSGAIVNIKKALHFEKSTRSVSCKNCQHMGLARSVDVYNNYLSCHAVQYFNFKSGIFERCGMRCSDLNNAGDCTMHSPGPLHWTVIKFFAPC